MLLPYIRITEFAHNISHKFLKLKVRLLTFSNAFSVFFFIKTSSLFKKGFQFSDLLFCGP